MKKDDVENLIGKGEVGNIFRQAEYEGIRIAYREDSVVSMTIDGGGEYKATRGAELGMLKTAMKKSFTSIFNHSPIGFPSFY